MKFSIITPTYQRSELLSRAINSVLEQSYAEWEMIIVNDSSFDEQYISVESELSDSRIRYYKNDENKGVNFSRNRALDLLSNDSDWIIFLDDDDYLAPNTLTILKNLITNHKNISWFLTNRAYTDGTPLTRFPYSEKLYSYAWDYLITKRCKGDATHCIQKNSIKNIRFLKTVPQGEEWFFFYQLGLHHKMYYSNQNTTLSDGYDQNSGLNFRKRTKIEQFQTLKKLALESSKKMGYHFTLFLYLFLRGVRVLVK